MEDDTTFLATVAEMVRNAGWDVTVSTTICDVPDRAYDLAFIDYYLPDGEGTSLMQDLRCPSILMTGNPLGITSLQAVRVILVKPFPLEVLRMFLRRS